MKIFTSLLFIFLFVTSNWSQNQKDLATANARAQKSGEIIRQFAALGTDSVPFVYLQKAKAVAVFPGLTRVNILLSELTLGNGIITVRSADNKWSAPVFLALKAQDVNLKIAGKKSFDAVVLFMDDESIERVKKGDVGFASGGKRRIALGPVIGGKGADEVKDAKVVYYAFDQGQLIDTGLSTDSFFKAVGILHDNNMNKAVFGMRTKRLFAAPESSLKIPAEIEKYRTVLIEVLPKTLPEQGADQTDQNKQPIK
jgi:lipid-binding SYLF domain-containing protein